jgi:site-specific DNA recombinase
MSNRAVIYARYSTDKQSKDSAEAQFATCREFAQRHDMEVVTTYADEGISGAAIGNRPQFKRMTAAALAREFDVLLVVDLSRVSRNQGDLSKFMERVTFAGVRVVGVQDGTDSLREENEMHVGMHGIIGTQFRRMIGKRTHGALKMRAQQGRSAGGRAYGYVTALRPDGTKWWAIVPAQAEWVRWIYDHYADGWSPRRIAGELNTLGIPSPGASWKRVSRRQDAKWLASTINGGILRNPLYVGQYVWNRSHWQKHPDSGKRIVTESRAKAECISHPAPELRIVDQALWDRVQARLSSRSADSVGITCTPRDGRRPYEARAGRRSKFPLSGLLKCADCGQNFVVVNAREYGCASHKDGGPAACANGHRVVRLHVEERVIGALRTELLTPERMARFRARIAARLNSAANTASKSDAARQERLAQVQVEIRNLVNLAKAGVASASLGAELKALEAEQEQLSAAPRHKAPVVRLIPDALRRYEAMVTALPTMLERDADRARDILRRLLGEVRLVRENGALFAELAMGPERLLTLAGVTPRETQNCVGSGGRI